GYKMINGAWTKVAPDSRVSSPAPSVRSGGSSWSKISPVSLASTPFLAPVGPVGGLGLPSLPSPEVAQDLVRRLELEALHGQTLQKAQAAQASKAKKPTSRCGAGLRTSFGRWCCGRGWDLVPQCAVLLVVIALLPAWLAPSLARSAGAAVAKNAALLVSDVAVAFAEGTVSVMREAWAGVDLADTSVNASGARFPVIGGVARQEFEASEVATALRPLPPEYSQWLWKAASRAGPRSPRFSASECRFKTASFFDYFEFEAPLFPSGYVGVRFIWARMGLAAAWANPLWELLGVDASSELAPVAARARGAISDALDLDWLRAPLTDDEGEARVAPPT
ncbi:unnamed protein product, partial [Prorocentrum cordatum]